MYRNIKIRPAHFSVAQISLKISILYLVLLQLLTGCSKTSSDIQSLAQLEGGKTFAVPTGTVADQSVLKRFPDARITYYNSVYDCALAVKNNKADAAVYDRPVLKNIAAKNTGLTVLDELLFPDYYGFAVAKDNVSLKEAMDETLASIKETGVYDEMISRWLPDKGDPGPMPAIANDATSGVLVFGTAAVTEPMSFYDGSQQVVGFDIEFALRIAASLNKRLEVVNLEFGAMLPALIAGKVDMIGAGLSITEERAKSVLFSESYYESGIAALVALPEDAGKDVAKHAENDENAGSIGISTDTENGIVKSQRTDYKDLGVIMGSIHEVYANKTYPNAIIRSYNSVPDMLLALSGKKIEAAFIDNTGAREILSTNSSFTILEKNLFVVDIGAGFQQQSDEFRETFNTFLSEIKGDGTFDDMTKRWMTDLNADMPDIKAENPTGTIKVGFVSDIGLPFSARVGNRYVGFDIELSSRFAAWSGKNIELVDMHFGSLIPSLVTGKIDMITASMMITEERSKQIDFSDPYHASGVSILGNAVSGEADADRKMAVLDDIADKKVGIFTGTVHDAYMEQTYPNARVFRFESTADMMLSLKSGKIDVAMFDLITAGLVMKRNPDLGMLTDAVLDMPLGVGFSKKNHELLAEFNAYLREIRQDGTYESMRDRWFVNDPEEADMPVFEKPGSGKKLVAGVSVEDLPYVAVMNGKYVGFDIEMIQTFAHRRGYDLSIITIEFPALVAALAAGKVDLITDGIAISEERAKQINFSDEYAIFRTAVIAPKSTLAGYHLEDMPGSKVEPSFLAKLADGFHNNIIREKRYVMILRGLMVTIIISIFAALTGTVLGGVVCFMRMSKNALLRTIASYYISLIRGTPVLVLLMIIYYVVFASVNINPVLVAVIAFGINFAAYVSEMFRTSILSVDRGQKEAGIASGFTKVQTFIYIIMPQALRQVLPVYKGEFVSLVKMTSIVGYIAVEDLTKASDIIRSRTFDAFFPLIMAAVIYIFIAWLLTLILDHIEVGVDPVKRRLSARKEVVK